MKIAVLEELEKKLKEQREEFAKQKKNKANDIFLLGFDFAMQIVNEFHNEESGELEKRLKQERNDELTNDMIKDEIARVKGLINDDIFDDYLNR